MPATRALLCLAWTAALVSGISYLVYVWGEENLNPWHDWGNPLPSYQYFYKPMEYGGQKTAVLLMNHDESTADLSLDFATIPGVRCRRCRVRDIWAHRDLGVFTGTYVARGVVSHDAPFLVVTPAE